MPSPSNDVFLPPCATMDPPFNGDSHVTRSPTTLVAQPRIDLRAQPPFSPPQAASNTYTGLTPAYLTYHPAHQYTNHQHYIGPTPLERAYQLDRHATFTTSRVTGHPFDSHFRTCSTARTSDSTGTATHPRTIKQEHSLGPRPSFRIACRTQSSYTTASRKESTAPGYGKDLSNACWTSGILVALDRLTGSDTTAWDFTFVQKSTVIDCQDGGRT